MIALLLAALAAQDPARDEAAQGLRRAAEYFRTKVACEGGYLWRYSDTLEAREGEGRASATTVWVQPPGTPAVGLAFLAAWEATADVFYLEAARDAARCLVRGQLRSGGWTYRIEFDPNERRRFAYRVDARPGRFNVSTLDDDTTQSALRLLMRVDRALEFKDASLHEAAEFALASLLKAQFPNGAWSQGFEGPPDPGKHPVKKAEIPGEWSRTWPGGDYWFQYTLNDNALADTLDVMLEAARLYSKPEYKAAAAKAGDFLLLAQLPEPQPAWAQQYDPLMRPAWARKFEPPAVSGLESQGAVRILLRLARETGDRKFLEPLPRAIEYLKSCRLADGRLSRFYELGTNKPLYLTRSYQLTYEDTDLPTHYGFKFADRTDDLARELEQVRADPKPKPPARPKADPARTRAVLAALDAEGRWVEDGRLRSLGPDGRRRVLECRTFVENVETLARHLAATRP